MRPRGTKGRYGENGMPRGAKGSVVGAYALRKVNVLTLVGLPACKHLMADLEAAGRDDGRRGRSLVEHVRRLLAYLLRSRIELFEGERRPQRHSEARQRQERAGGCSAVRSMPRGIHGVVTRGARTFFLRKSSLLPSPPPEAFSHCWAACWRRRSTMRSWNERRRRSAKVSEGHGRGRDGEVLGYMDEIGAWDEMW